MKLAASRRWAARALIMVLAVLFGTTGAGATGGAATTWPSGTFTFTFTFTYSYHNAPQFLRATHVGVALTAAGVTPRRVAGSAEGLHSISGPAGVGAEDGALAVAAEGPSGVPNFENPAASPGEGWEWRGTGEPGSTKGSWYNPETGESLHPAVGHPDPIGPHYDWKAPDGTTYRVYPDGRIVPK